MSPAPFSCLCMFGLVLEARCLLSFTVFDGSVLCCLAELAIVRLILLCFMGLPNCIAAQSEHMNANNAGRKGVHLNAKSLLERSNAL